MKLFPTSRKVLDRLESGSPPDERPSTDPHAVNERIQQALEAAGLLKRTGPSGAVRDTIERALSAAGLMSPGEPPLASVSNTPSSDVAPLKLPLSSKDPGRGEFLDRSFTCMAGTRAYKVYVPRMYTEDMTEPRALVVMLHGCTQSPDDFAVGTRMNTFAERNGFLVAYPAQVPNSNASKCWNWFRREDQMRDLGEPSIIAGITRTIISDYRIDESRVFVAGLSAGAAMAVILGETYPDLYAAVGAHSGIPFRAAHDVSSAFAAMKCGAVPSDGEHPADANRLRNIGTRTIVFHGDGDRTVSPQNGVLIVERAKQGRSATSPLTVHIEEGTAVDGGRYCRTVYTDTADLPVIEHWVVRDAGHAWSGGNPAGTFADHKGPDASAAMVRFFLG